MPPIIFITPHFAITGALAPADFAAASALGFQAILNNRPDDEEEGQLTSLAEAELAWSAGLRYRHLPLDKHELFTDPVVGGMSAALLELDGPVLAHCKSGLRCAIVWAAASARTLPVDEVLARLATAGLELDFLRDDLEAQADRPHWLPHVEAATTNGQESAGTSLEFAA